MSRGDFTQGDFVLGRILSRGIFIQGILSWGFCPGGICPDTDLDAKNKKSLVNAKCYCKEIMSSRSLPFIYVGLHTDYISAFTW